MGREHNFLLGKGELLTGTVEVPSGGGPKNPPYQFPKAKQRITEKLQDTTQSLSSVPTRACPGQEVVAVMTIHPRYISKSDFPSDLLKATGLRAIGTRPKKIKPESWGIKKHPSEAVAEQIFVAGQKESFDTWLRQIPNWTENTPGALTLTQIEDLKAFQPEEKLRSIPEDRNDVVLEVVLHNQGRNQIIREFEAYAKDIGATAFLDRAHTISGLTFLPVRVKAARAKDLAAFTFVRVARGMPTIRPLPAGMARSNLGFDVELPAEGPHSSDLRTVIFDGGLPESVDLRKWVRYIEPTGIGAPIPGLVQHGLAVTSAFLFGCLEKGKPARRPYCSVDHVRVLGAGENADMEYIEVLDRILNYLDTNKGNYSFVNISLGPDFSVEDDDVNLWTSSLDQRFCTDQVLATIAAGNSGERDAKLQLNRIQPPSDGVNVLSVGACDTLKPKWKRASYSSIGPGRSPGFVKPDGVAFGGTDVEPFMVLDASSKPTSFPITGTSFASPFVLGGAVGTRVLAGSELSPLTLRALLIHRADAGKNPKNEVGWGLLQTDPSLLMTCEDHEALVVYQGTLPLGQHLRAALPVPTGPIAGKVKLSATLAIAPEVDPEHPGSYTKGGLEVTFRPDSRKFRKEIEGKKPAHAKTKPFFSGAKLFKGGEFRLREEGYKWEPCMRNDLSMLGSSLFEPCFDIWYHHRDSAVAAKEPKALPYALVITLSTKDTDFYNRVVRTYAQVLVPLRSKIQIPVRA